MRNNMIMNFPVILRSIGVRGGVGSKGFSSQCLLSYLAFLVCFYCVEFIPIVCTMQHALLFLSFCCLLIYKIQLANPALTKI